MSSRLRASTVRYGYMTSRFEHFCSGTLRDSGIQMRSCSPEVSIDVRIAQSNGFSFGFSVVSYFEIINGVVKLISLRTQPLDVESASDIAPFVDSVSGKDFVNYDLVKEKATPTLSEVEMAKNKLPYL